MHLLKHLPRAPDKRLSRCLKLFSTLARPQLALHNRSAETGSAVSTEFCGAGQATAGILHDYVELAGILAAQLPNQFETFVKHPED